MNDLTVKQAIAQFYERNNFDQDGGVTPPVVWLKLGPIPLPIFNIPSRRRALRMHDIHHVVMRYQATWKGEAEVSAWEVASGGWGRLWYVWGIVLSGLALGVVFFPRATRVAFQNGLTMRNAFVCGLSEAEMLGMSVSALREKLETGVYTGRSYFLWALLSVSLVAIPAVLGVLVLWVVWG